MMAIDRQGQILVDYSYTATLPSGSYTFEMWTVDDETSERDGPNVEDC